MTHSLVLLFYSYCCLIDVTIAITIAGGATSGFEEKCCDLLRLIED